jgi:hypothetical protein
MFPLFRLRVERLDGRDLPSSRTVYDHLAVTVSNSDAVATNASMISLTDTPGEGTAAVSMGDSTVYLVGATYNVLTENWDATLDLSVATAVDVTVLSSSTPSADPTSPTPPTPILDEYFEKRQALKNNLGEQIELKIQQYTLQAEIDELNVQLVIERLKPNPDQNRIADLENQLVNKQCELDSTKYEFQQKQEEASAISDRMKQLEGSIREVIPIKPLGRLPTEAEVGAIAEREMQRRRQIEEGPGPGATENPSVPDDVLVELVDLDDAFTQGPGSTE